MLRLRSQLQNAEVKKKFDEKVKIVLDCLRQNIVKQKDITVLPIYVSGLGLVETMLTIDDSDNAQHTEEDIIRLDAEWDALAVQVLGLKGESDHTAYEALCAFYENYLSDQKKFFESFPLLVDHLGYDASYYQKIDRELESDSPEGFMFALDNDDYFRGNEPLKLRAIGKYLHVVHQQSEDAYQDALDRFLQYEHLEPGSLGAIERKRQFIDAYNAVGHKQKRKVLAVTPISYEQRQLVYARVVEELENVEPGADLETVTGRVKRKLVDDLRESEKKVRTEEQRVQEIIERNNQQLEEIQRALVQSEGTVNEQRGTIAEQAVQLLALRNELTQMHAERKAEQEAAQQQIQDLQRQLRMYTEAAARRTQTLADVRAREQARQQQEIRAQIAREQVAREQAARIAREQVAQQVVAQQPVVQVCVAMQQQVAPQVLVQPAEVVIQAAAARAEVVQAAALARAAARAIARRG